MSETPATRTPVRLGLARLIVGVAVAMIIAGGLMAGVLAVIGDASLWRGLAAASVIVAIAAALSVLPIWIGAQMMGVAGAAGGFMLAGFARAGLSIAGCLAVIWKWDYPPMTTVLCMGVHYMAVLAAESIIVAKAIWSRPIE